MDFKSAGRIANFVNDVGGCEVIFHLHELKHVLSLEVGMGDDAIRVEQEYYPVVTLTMGGYNQNLKADLKVIPVKKQDELNNDGYNYRDLKSIPYIEYYEHYAYNHYSEIFEFLRSEYNIAKCDWYINSASIRDFMSFVGGVQEHFITPFDHLYIQKEAYARDNQLPLCKVIGKVFAMYKPEVICLSLGELTKQGTALLVPVCMDNGWSLYLSQNLGLEYGKPHHHTTLWDGFDDEGVKYFNAHITRNTQYNFCELLKEHGFEMTTQLAEFVANFTLNPVSGDVVPRTKLTEILETQ